MSSNEERKIKALEDEVTRLINELELIKSGMMHVYWMFEYYTDFISRPDRDLKQLRDYIELSIGQSLGD